MTSINTTYQHTVTPQTTSEENPPLRQVSRGYFGDAIGQYIAAMLEKKERIPAISTEVQRRLEEQRELLKQYVLENNAEEKEGSGSYIDDKNNLRDAAGNLIDVGNWINNWLDQKRISAARV